VGPFRSSVPRERERKEGDTWLCVEEKGKKLKFLWQKKWGGEKRGLFKKKKNGP